MHTPPPPPKKSSTALTVLLVLGLCVLIIGGPLATLAVVGVRRYLSNAKTAEARSTVAAIARACVRSSEDRASLSGKPIVLTSLPAVPSTVPAAAKYQSSSTDWAAWNAIKFQISMPQYYQYEVQASPDGKEADVIVRGDLNGDGKTSTFSLHLQVSGSTVVTAPTLKETDPFE